MVRSEDVPIIRVDMVTSGVHWTKQSNRLCGESWSLLLAYIKQPFIPCHTMVAGYYGFSLVV